MPQSGDCPRTTRDREGEHRERTAHPDAGRRSSSSPGCCPGRAPACGTRSAPCPSVPLAAPIVLARDRRRPAGHGALAALPAARPSGSAARARRASTRMMAARAVVFGQASALVAAAGLRACTAARASSCWSRSTSPPAATRPSTPASRSLAGIARDSGRPLPGARLQAPGGRRRRQRRRRRAYGVPDRPARPPRCGRAPSQRAMIRLIASARVAGVAQLAAHGRGDRLRAGLADPAHRHAHVLALDDDDHAARLQDLHQRVGDLRGQPLLHLRAAGVDVDQPGQLRQAGDLAVGGRDVADVGDADERHQVVLAAAETPRCP